MSDRFIAGLVPLSEIPESVWLLIAKLFGAISGSAISIVYILPSGRREAMARFFVSFGIGLIFGPATGFAMADYLGVANRISSTEITLSGAAAASLGAWWGLGLLVRLAKRPEV
ncbi:MAG: DUF6107 family protein [Pseudomonadota bacterium]